MAKRLTSFILIGMILGVITGYVAHAWIGPNKDLAEEVAGYFHLLADIFLHLIKCPSKASGEPQQEAQRQSRFRGRMPTERGERSVDAQARERHPHSTA